MAEKPDDSAAATDTTTYRPKTAYSNIHGGVETTEDSAVDKARLSSAEGLGSAQLSASDASDPRPTKEKGETDMSASYRTRLREWNDREAARKTARTTKVKEMAGK